jgi:hypothetical protein
MRKAEDAVQQIGRSLGYAGKGGKWLVDSGWWIVKTSGTLWLGSGLTREIRRSFLSTIHYPLTTVITLIIM